MLKRVSRTSLKVSSLGGQGRTPGSNSPMRRMRACSSSSKQALAAWRSSLWVWYQSRSLLASRAVR